MQKKYKIRKKYKSLLKKIKSVFSRRKTESNFTRIIDKTCMFLSFAIPLSAFPQIWEIYSNKNVGGVSLLSWVLYLLGAIPFLMYGIIHKQKEIIILNASWITTELVIVVGILLYGEHQLILAFG